MIRLKISISTFLLSSVLALPEPEAGLGVEDMVSLSRYEILLKASIINLKKLYLTYYPQRAGLIVRRFGKITFVTLSIDLYKMWGKST